MAGEVLRFMAVGGVATLISFVGFNALAHGLFLASAPLGGQPLLAYVVANGVAGVVAYAGLRTWAFRHRDVGDPVGGPIRFFGLGAVTLAIPLVCLWISRYGLGLSSTLADNVSANLIGLSLGTAARFWVFRRFVFDTPTPHAPTGLG